MFYYPVFLFPWSYFCFTLLIYSLTSFKIITFILNFYPIPANKLASVVQLWSTFNIVYTCQASSYFAVSPNSPDAQPGQPQGRDAQESRTLLTTIFTSPRISLRQSFGLNSKEGVAQKEDSVFPGISPPTLQFVRSRDFCFYSWQTNFDQPSQRTTTETGQNTKCSDGGYVLAMTEYWLRWPL